MNTLSNGIFEIAGEEQEEEYEPQIICVKKEVLEEEICESETASCSDARTTTGNILERMIAHPECRRPPCLGKWPSFPPKSESDFQDNVHQFRASQKPTLLSQMCSLKVTSEPNIFRQPAIIGTLGPASVDVSSIVELFEAGLNIVRISMAHVNPCSGTEYIQNIIEASNQYKTIKDYEVPIPIMMDLKGLEIRTGKINATRSNRCTSEIVLKQNSCVRLTTNSLFIEKCTEKIIYVDYEKLCDVVSEGMIIYISDGEIKLKVNSLESGNIVCSVEVEGILRSNQKVYIPSLIAPFPAFSDFDKECLELAVQKDIDIIVIPKTRNQEIIKEVKRYLRDLQEDNNILILAKISNYEGIENIDEILRVADGIVLEKNDLSLEIAGEKMLIAQKQIIGKCNRVGKPVLCTAQLCFKQSSSIILKRIAMTDIGGAIIDGADGIILSGETAVDDKGPHTVKELSKIIRESEAATMQKPYYFDLVSEQIVSMEPMKAVALAAVQIANKIQASAILAVTTSGKTAQLLSWFRPRRPVIAISRVGKTARQLNLFRAVIPLHFSAPPLPDWFHDVKARFEYGISFGRDCGIIESGDLLVLVSGYRKNSGFTNCIRIVFASLEKSGFVDSVSNYYGSAPDSSHT